MVRSSMDALIARVRQLIADPAPGTLPDDQLQDALDRRRVERRWVALRPMPTFTPGGTTIYLDYYHDAGNWEDDTQFQDLTYATITPVVLEPLVGHWQFAAQPTGIGVRVTGKTYDPYGSAADLLEGYAATLKLNYAFTTASQQFQTQQQVLHCLELAARYRAQALPQTMRLFQGDAAPDQDGGGVTYPSIRAEGGY